MYFVAVDLGATYVKSARIRASDRKLENVHRVRFPEGDLTEASILGAFQSALTHQLAAPGRCQGIFLSNQMHGLVLVRPSGEWASPFISWQDQRSRLPFKSGSPSSFERLKEESFGFAWQHETGEFLRVGFPITQLFHLKTTGFDLTGLVPLDLGNAVLNRLLRLNSLKIETTNASAMGCYRVSTGHWHQELLTQLGLDQLLWPEICRSNDILGYYSWASHQIPVFFSVGDQQVSLLGAGLQSKNQISSNIATGSQVSVLVDELELGDFQIRPFFDRWIRTLTHIPAGRSLNSLVRVLTEVTPEIDFEEAWTRLSRLAERSDEPSLELDLAFFPSAFGSSGRISEITEANFSAGALMRAALREVAKSHLRGFQRLNVKLSDYTEVLGSGGLLKKSTVLQQYLGNEFQRPVSLSDHLEDALMGHAVRVQMI